MNGRKTICWCSISWLLLALMAKLSFLWHVTVVFLLRFTATSFVTFCMEGKSFWDRVNHMASNFDAKISAQTLRCSSGHGPTKFHPPPLYWGGVSDGSLKTSSDKTETVCMARYYQRYSSGKVECLCNLTFKPQKELPEKQNNTISEIYKYKAFFGRGHKKHLSPLITTIAYCIYAEVQQHFDHISNITTLKDTDKT